MRQNVEKVFAEWFGIATELAAELDLTPSIPRRYARQGHRDNHPGETPEAYYRQAVAIPLLDSIITELKDRFSEQQRVIRGAIMLIPSVLVTQRNKAAWKANSVEFATLHQDSMPSFALLQTELDLWYQKWTESEDLPEDAQTA